MVWDHPLLGRNGEALGTDVVGFGPVDAPHVLLIVSATHGVEGYAGSALQSAWVELGPAIPDDTAVVLVHGINPFGFSFDRRVNEDNVDLNRNFVDWSQPVPASPDYDAIASLVVPPEWTAEAQAESTAALLDLVVAEGLEKVQAAISGGQYSHPNGVFYGGTGPTWSHRSLREILTKFAAAAARVTIVDLHTGLGPWGHGELISPSGSGAADFKRAQQLWGEVTSMVDNTSVSAPVMGEWLSQVPKWLPDAEVTGVALEYGTVDPVTVLQALRADAWRHGAEEVSPELDDEIRLQLRSVFLDDGAAWASELWLRFIQVVDAAIGAPTLPS